ncbi:MAG: DUF2793 domain-containing protein [Pseudomonadota bacterium]
MTDHSPSLGLPFMAPAQAQKHILLNEALSLLDGAVQLVLWAIGALAPPDDPAEGAVFALADSPTGAWNGQGGRLALWTAGGWRFLAPQAGWRAWDRTADRAVRHDGAGWVSETPEQAPRFGVNTPADPVNRLAVKSDAVLLSHDDVSPGSGDMRLVFNKAAPDRTGSLLFQSAYSGRAEVGLAGQDDLSVKTSADGSVWTEALRIDAGTGRVRLPATPLASAQLNLLPDSGRFSVTDPSTDPGAGAFRAPDYLSPYNGSVFSAGGKYFSGSQTYGGPEATLDEPVRDLIDRLRSPSRRAYGTAFHLLRITAGSGTGAPIRVGGNDYPLIMTNRGAIVPPEFFLNIHLRVESGAAAVGRFQSLFIDGVEQDGPVSLDPVDGWVQVTQQSVSPEAEAFDYDFNFSRIGASPGTQLLIALPVLAVGTLDMGPGRLIGARPSLRAWS